MSDRPKDYVAVSTVGTFKMTYMIPVAEVQKMVGEGSLVDQDYLDTLCGATVASIHREEVKDAGQRFLGELVQDVNVISTERAIQRIREENAMGDMTDEKIIKFIDNWKEETTWNAKEQASKKDVVL